MVDSKNPAGLANLARNARNWKSQGTKRTDSDHSERMYGKDSKAKVLTSSEAKHPPRQNIRGTHHRD